MKAKLLFIISLIGNIVLAQDRKLIHTDKEIKLYVYPDTIQPDYNGYYKVWTDMVFHKPKKMGNYTISMTENFFLVDCQRNRFSLIATNGYNKNGVEVFNDAQGEYQARRNLLPATRGYSSYKVIEYVCKNK